MNTSAGMMAEVGDLVIPVVVAVVVVAVMVGSDTCHCTTSRRLWDFGLHCKNMLREKGKILHLPWTAVKPCSSRVMVHHNHHE